MTDETKTQETTDVALRPSTAGQIDFSKQVNDYQAILSEEAELKKAREEAKAALRKVEVEHGLSSYLSNAESIKIYLPVEKKETDLSLVGDDARYEAEQFLGELTTRAKNALIRLIGSEAYKVLEQIADYDEDKDVEKKLDEAKTQAARTAWQEAYDKVQVIDRALDNVAERRKNAKEYVAYVKDVASIAASAKDFNK